MNYKALNKKTIREGFNDFIAQNPHIYDAFEKQCYKAIKAGRKKVSAKMIINVIRWEISLESTDKNFKINDAYQSYFARLFAEKNPDHSYIFNFRKLRNEVGGQYMEVETDGTITFL